MQVIMAVAVQHCNIVGAGPCEIMHSTNSRNRNSQGTFGFEMAKFDSAAEVVEATADFMTFAPYLHVAHWQRNHVRGLRTDALIQMGSSEGKSEACRLLLESLEAEAAQLPSHYLPRLRTWQRFKKLLKELPVAEQRDIEMEATRCNIDYQHLMCMEAWNTSYHDSHIPLWLKRFLDSNQSF